MTVQSNTATATTFDIEAPTLSAVAGPGFDQVTLSFTGIPGSHGTYWIFGAPHNSGNYVGTAEFYNVAAGQTVTRITNTFGVSNFLDTNKSYDFYLRTASGSRYRESSVVSATTFDIGAPTLMATQLDDTHAKLTWSIVNGAMGYTLYTFNSAQNRWDVVAGIPQPAAGEEISYTANLLAANQTYYYYVTANRGSRMRSSNTVSVASYKDQDAGSGSCNIKVGEPVNVSNGNMYIQQSDYNLPGIGEGINLTRAYNSMIQNSGWFGYGWATSYDEYLTSINNYTVRIALADGRAVYFGRTDIAAPFSSLTPDFYGQLTKNSDNTYTLTFKDGRIHKYSSTGRLLWQKDRNGNQTTLTYDGSGNLSGIADAFGRTLSVTTNLGLVTQISDSIGTVATYEYFPGTTRLKTVTYNDGSKYKYEYIDKIVNGQTRTYLTTVKDALDNILETHLYDSQGRATTSEKAGGVEKYTLDYTNANSSTNPHTIVTDALGRVTKYYFDKSKGRNVVTKTEGNCNCGSGSQVTQYFYDARLNLTKKIDALGREINYTYDGNGNRLTETDVLGAEIYTYNSFGQVLTRTDRMNGITTNTYNAQGNLLTTKDALNNTTLLTYKPNGLLETVKDARNNTTTLTYDAFGRLTQIKDANLKLTTYTYDARGRVLTMKNALNYTTTFGYDLANRVNKITHPDLKFVEYGYDLAGRRTSMKDERGNLSTYGYDNAYRLISMTDALNHTTTFGYDLMSNRTSQTDALTNTTDYEYDDFNRLKKVIYPPATTGAIRLEESLTYDALGNIETRTDTAGRTTSYDYDTANRLQSVTDADLKTTVFEYNARNQMTAVVDALTQRYEFSYDALGRQLSQTRAGNVMTYEYDAVGNRTRRTDYLNQITNYTYDNLNRLTNINYPDATENTTLTYDVISRLTKATKNAQDVTFVYDKRDRMTSTTDVHSKIVAMTCDAASNRTALKLDGVNFSTYAYDVANRMTRITNSADAKAVNYLYDNAKRMTKETLPNGIATTFAYDGMSRLTQLKDAKGATTLFDRQLSYNPASQISQIAELTQTRNFNYDAVDRLTSVSGSSSESYAFDGVGNRTSSHLSASYTHQPFNKLTNTTTASYLYNSNGNMVSKSDASGMTQYVWDYENRLKQVIKSNGENVIYKYDALGRRSERNVNGTSWQKYTYDGQDVMLDQNSDGTTVTYLNGAGIDNKLRQTVGRQAQYFLNDHLGSTNALTDATGNIISATNYDSFGNATNANFPTRYQFTGREFDSFTGLHYYRARFYDANLGRFISEDPIGFAGGDVNLFEYVWNNPIKFTDPSGLQAGSGIQFLPEGEYGKKWYQAIEEDFNDMKNSCECRKSFEGFGIDLDNLSRLGMFVGSGDTLRDSKYKSSDLGLSDRDRRLIANRDSRATTLMGGEYDERPHIFFNSAAKANAWSPFSDSRCNVRQAFAHELMHAGKIPGREPSKFAQMFLFQDDLSYLNGYPAWDKPYSSLLKNCGCQ